MTARERAFDLQNVTVRIRPELAAAGSRPLLDGISLGMKPGEWVSVMGRNGSGKTTLVRVLAGLLEGYVCSGTVERGFAGEAAIPYVMQQPDLQLFGDTPWEDVVFSLEQQGMASSSVIPAAEKALRQVGLGGLERRKLSALSGGQKQLAAIAGCIAADAPLLICDECTSMLDPVSRRLVLDTVRGLHRKGRTVVWLTQRVEEAVYGNRIVMLEQGRKVFDGTTNAFFYGTDEDTESSPCRQFGLEPPYWIQIADSMIAAGASLGTAPLTPEELVKAVSVR